jgi:hypothetical protein
MGWNDHIELDPVLFWDIEDKFVCHQCLYDEGLKVFVAERVADLGFACSYCNGESKSVPVAELQAHIRNYFPYGLAEEELPLDPDRGAKFFGAQWDCWEALESILGLKVCDELYEDFNENLVDRLYCQANWATAPLDAQWKGQWEEFRTAIRRGPGGGFYLSTTVPDEERNHDEPHPAFFFNAIVTALLRADAVSVLDSGTCIQRVRWGHVEATFEKLTCPSSKDAGANRFSPKGVSMFYGASNLKTACLEIKANPGDLVTQGVFKTQRDLTLIDFTSAKFPKGNFDPLWMGNYHIAEFLRGFLADIRKDVKGEGDAADYLPTQALCDFFVKDGASELLLVNMNDPQPPKVLEQIAATSRLDGIRFRSSKVGGADGDCFVLFCDHEESRTLLELVDHDHLIFK